MSKDEIIAMARQSGFDAYKNETAGVEGYDCTEELERFAALVAAREREKCATECESLSHRSRWVRAAINGALMETCQYAAAIRSGLEGKQ